MKRVRNSPFVIAISSVSGGGKTTITTLLNEKLNQSKTLHFDDYDFDGPEDIPDWVANGSDYTKWNLTSLVDDLESLLSEPLQYVLLDYPFAYLHPHARRFIDFAVFIDTPLDIAMSRRILRDFRKSSIEDVLWDMENYLSRGRQAYQEMLKTVRPNCDFIVDGSLSCSDIVDEVLRQIEQM